MTNKLYDAIRKNKTLTAGMVIYSMGFGTTFWGAAQDKPEPTPRVQRVLELEKSLLAENALVGLTLNDWVLNHSKVDSTFEAANARRDELDSLYSTAKEEIDSYGIESRDYTDRVRDTTKIGFFIAGSSIPLLFFGLAGRARDKYRGETQ